VLQAVHLRGDLAGNLGIAVPDRDREDAAEEVEVLVAVEILEVLHLAAVGHQGLLEVVGNGWPEVFLVPSDDFVAARAAGKLPSGNEMSGSGHGRVLAQIWIDRVYDGRRG
jgi:hypothetical protein